MSTPSRRRPPSPRRVAGEVRPSRRGDVPPKLEPEAIGARVAAVRTVAAQNGVVAAAEGLLHPAHPDAVSDRARALRALIEGADPEDARVLRSALLPEATPSPLRRLVGSLPGGVLSPLNDTVSEAINPLQAGQLRRNLDQLLVLVRHSSYLEGERITLADLAVVAQLSLLRFADNAGAPLAGRGVKGFGDNPVYGPLFAWRDRILAEVGRS